MARKVLAEDGGVQLNGLGTLEAHIFKNNSKKNLKFGDSTPGEQIKVTFRKSDPLRDLLKANKGVLVRHGKTRSSGKLE